MTQLVGDELEEWQMTQLLGEEQEVWHLSQQVDAC